MPQTLFLQPAAGRRVLNPATRQPLGPGGLAVADDSPHITYWLRRLAEGDVASVSDPGGATDPQTASKGAAA